jgi:hypothetical protein
MRGLPLDHARAVAAARASLDPAPRRHATLRRSSRCAELDVVRASAPRSSSASSMHVTSRGRWPCASTLRRLASTVAAAAAAPATVTVAVAATAAATVAVAATAAATVAATVAAVAVAVAATAAATVPVSATVSATVSVSVPGDPRPSRAPLRPPVAFSFPGCRARAGPRPMQRSGGITARRLCGLVALAAATSVAPAHADEPFPFEVQNARAGLFARAGAGEWRRTIRLVVAGDVPQSTERLAIPPVPLETDDGAAATLIATPPPLRTLGAGDALPLELSATLPAPGVYRGELVLVVAPRQRVIPVEITVAAPTATPPGPAPLALHGGSALAITGDRSTFDVRLRNTGSAPIAVPPLRLAGVSRVDDAGGPSWQVPSEGVVPAGETRTIAPGAVEVFAVTAQHFAEPGIYDVDLVVAPAGTEPLVITRRVFRRWPWWWAALAVAAGALIAGAVRRFATGGQKRLELRRRIAYLGEQVRATRGEGRDEAHLGAARALEVDVLDRLRDLRWGVAPGTVEDVIERAELRLALLREVIAASRELVRLDAPRQTEPRRVLDAALVAVRTDPGAADVVQNLRKDVADLLLHHAWRVQLSDHLGQIEAQLATQLAVAAEDGRAALSRQVDPPLAAARGALRTDDLHAAHDALTAAQAGLLAAAIAAVQSQMDASPPPGVGPDLWQDTREQIGALLVDAARVEAPLANRFAGLRRAQETFFRVAVEGLLAVLASPPAGAVLARVELYRATEIELRQALARGVDEAARLYWDRRRVVERVERNGAAAAPGAVARGDERTLAGGWLPSVFHAIAGLGEHDLPSATLHRGIKAVGGVVSVLVLALAVLSGLEALWWPDRSWGGARDLLVALMWGAGAQATGDALATVTGLRDKLGFGARA